MKTFGHLMTFRFGTFAMLFVPLGVLLVMRTLEDERYTVIKAYKFTVVKRFFGIITLSLYI